MTYNVINKDTGELKSLTHSEVNDMDYDSMDQEAHYLIADSGLIADSLRSSVEPSCPSLLSLIEKWNESRQNSNSTLPSFGHRL